VTALRDWYRYLARLSLLVAALLYAAGAAAGPVTHAALLQQEGSQPDQPQHDSQHCLLCHAPGHATMSVGGDGPVGVTLAWSPEYREPADSPRVRSHTPTRARAPPRV
jgi:hypothetical protein